MRAMLDSGSRAGFANTQNVSAQSNRGEKRKKKKKKGVQEKRKEAQAELGLGTDSRSRTGSSRGKGKAVSKQQPREPTTPDVQSVDTSDCSSRVCKRRAAVSRSPDCFLLM